MHCMKCGREIEEGNVFCIDCLKDMEKYPIRPGTAVHLPQHPGYSHMRRQPPKRKVLPPEEIIKRQRKLIHHLFWSLVVAAALVILMAYPTITHLLESNDFPIGQNFKVIEELLPNGQETE